MRVTIAAIVTAVGLLQPALAWAEEADDDEEEAGYTTKIEEQEVLPNGPLLATALLTFSGGYLPAVVTGAVSERREDRYLFLPFAGPWVDLGLREKCTASGVACSTEDTERALLIAMGVAQGIGAVLFGLSLVVPEKRVVETTSAKVWMAPSVSANGASLGVIGRF